MFRCFEHDTNIIVSYYRIFEKPLGIYSNLLLLSFALDTDYMVNRYPVTNIPSIDDNSLPFPRTFPSPTCLFRNMMSLEKEKEKKLKLNDGRFPINNSGQSNKEGN